MALTTSKSTSSLKATIIRADGTRENLGVVWHSNPIKNVYYKMKRRFFEWLK